MTSSLYAWQMPGVLRVEPLREGVDVAYLPARVEVCALRTRDLYPMWADVAMTKPMTNPFTTDDDGRPPLSIFAMPGVADLWAEDRLIKRISVRPNLAEMQQLFGVLETLVPLIPAVEALVSYIPNAPTSAQVAAIKGAIRSNIRAVSTATTAVAGDEILATAGAGGFVVTLPAAATDISVTVKKVDSGAGTITVTPASGTIDGAANFPITVQYQSVDFISDGTNWFVA